jgi:hypothetical protein
VRLEYCDPCSPWKQYLSEGTLDKFLHLSLKNFNDRVEEYRFFWQEVITTIITVNQQAPYITFLENE